MSLGEPAPTNGWEAGHFYVVVRPAPLIEICTKISYPGLSILRPDSYEQLRLAHTVVYVGRELVDNRYKCLLALFVPRLRFRQCFIQMNLIVFELNQPRSPLCATFFLRIYSMILLLLISAVYGCLIRHLVLARRQVV